MSGMTKRLQAYLAIALAIATAASLDPLSLIDQAVRACDREAVDVKESKSADLPSGKIRKAQVCQIYVNLMIISCHI
jgi:hypothetical protein